MRLKTFKNIDTMDTKDKINNIEDKNVDVQGNDASVGGVETTIQEPVEKEASIAATAVETAKEVANVAGAAVKGTVKTVGVFAKVMGGAGSMMGEGMEMSDSMKEFMAMMRLSDMLKMMGAGIPGEVKLQLNEALTKIKK